MLQPTTLHLIDVENLAGGSDSSAVGVRDAIAAYWSLAERGPADHSVAASGPTLAPIAAFAVDRSRFVIGRGLDGADAALVAWAQDREWVARRFDRLVVGSGDGYFAPLVEDLRRRGLNTTVISRRTALSAALARAASEVRWLDGPRLTPVPGQALMPNRTSPTLAACGRGSNESRGSRDADAA